MSEKFGRRIEVGIENPDDFTKEIETYIEKHGPFVFNPETDNQVSELHRYNDIKSKIDQYISLFNAYEKRDARPGYMQPPEFLDAKYWLEQRKKEVNYVLERIQEELEKTESLQLQ